MILKPKCLVFCLQLESEATHRAVTIANRVRVHHNTACFIILFIFLTIFWYSGCRPTAPFTWSMCPVCLLETWSLLQRCRVSFDAQPKTTGTVV